MSDVTLAIDPALWDVLACPCPEHGAVAPVQPSDDLPEGGVTCTVCRRIFPIRGGIPVMLLDEAISPQA